MKNARGDGKTAVFTATGAVASGNFVEAGDVVGVAAEDAASGETFTAFIEGEFEGPTTGSPSVGDAVNWNGTAWAGSGVPGGQGVVTKVVGANLAWVKLTPG